VIHDLERPGLVGVQAVDLDREGIAVDDDLLAFASGEQVWCIVGHAAVLML
jgi:hypothetical protein